VSLQKCHLIHTFTLAPWLAQQQRGLLLLVVMLPNQPKQLQPQSLMQAFLQRCFATVNAA
jgi:hypothetical protein